MPKFVSLGDLYSADLLGLAFRRVAWLRAEVTCFDSEKVVRYMSYISLFGPYLMIATWKIAQL